MTFSMPPLPPPAAPSSPPTREEIFAEYRSYARECAERQDPPGLRDDRRLWGEDFVGERLEHDDERQARFALAIGPCPYSDFSAPNREEWKALDEVFCKVFTARMIELHGPAGVDIVDHDGSKWLLDDTTGGSASCRMPGGSWRSAPSGRMRR